MWGLALTEPVWMEEDQRTGSSMSMVTTMDMIIGRRS